MKEEHRINVYKFRDYLRKDMKWLSEEYMSLNPIHRLDYDIYFSYDAQDRLCINEQLIGEYLENISKN